MKGRRLLAISIGTFSVYLAGLVASALTRNSPWYYHDSAIAVCAVAGLAYAFAWSTWVVGIQRLRLAARTVSIITYTLSRPCINGEHGECRYEACECAHHGE